MDEGLNRESTSKGVSDSLGSPDAFSNPSSSIGGSQGSPGAPMDCDQNSWPENGIEAVGTLIISSIKDFSQSDLVQCRHYLYRTIAEKP